MAFPPCNLIVNSSLPQQRVALQPSKQTVIFVTTAMVTKPYYLLPQQQQFRSTLIIFIYFSAAEFFLITPAVAPMLKNKKTILHCHSSDLLSATAGAFFSLSKFFLGGNDQILSNVSTTKLLAIGRQLAVFHKPFLGSYYSELEQSLGFEPPSRTASQVRLPLSGRAAWAGELVKCCKCYVTMKIMHILCLLCSQIHIKLSVHAEMEFHCIH